MRTAFHILHYTLTIAFILLFASCTDKVPDTHVKDIDGNVYPTCTIGNKVWMAANLRVTGTAMAILYP